MAKSEKSGYLNAAMLMLVSGVVVKVIGAVYKIPLTAFIGAVGRGYFAAAYNLYMPLHAVLLGSFPIALSRLVSMALAQQNANRAVALQRSSFGLFLFAGLIGSAVIAAAAVPYAVYVAGTTKCVFTALVLAPSLLFSMLAACYRSYFEGCMNMVPTAVSQLLEAVFKMLLGLLFAKAAMTYLSGQYMLEGAVPGTAVASEEKALSEIYPLTSAAAMLGVTAGSLLSFGYTWVYFRRHRLKYNCCLPPRQGRRELLQFAFPIMLSSAVQSVFQFLDTASVQRALASVPAAQLRAVYDSGLHAVGVADADLVTYTYGLFSTALDFKNLVPGITMVLGVCAVPAVCREYEQGNRERTGILINAVMKYTVLLSVFLSAAVFMTAETLLQLFYGSSAPDVAEGCAPLVRSFALTLPLYSLASTAVFSVQALGKPSRSVVPYAVSGIVRVVLNYSLVGGTLLLQGAVVSGAVGYLLLSVSNLVITYRLAKCPPDAVNVFVKPCGVGIVSVIVCRLLPEVRFLSGHLLIHLLMKSVVFAVVFCMLCFTCRAVDFEEIISVFKKKKMA